MAYCLFKGFKTNVEEILYRTAFKSLKNIAAIGSGSAGIMIDLICFNDQIAKDMIRPISHHGRKKSSTPHVTLDDSFSYFAVNDPENSDILGLLT